MFFFFVCVCEERRVLGNVTMVSDKGYNVVGNLFSKYWSPTFVEVVALCKSYEKLGVLRTLCESDFNKDQLIRDNMENQLSSFYQPPLETHSQQYRHSDEISRAGIHI